VTESVAEGVLVAVNGSVTLAGTVWLPGAGTRAGVLMFPGSGPSDRHNDVFFPPVREHLVDRGIAVASFDKRGVGGSGGDWLSVGLDVLATDAIAEMDAFRALDDVPSDRVGLFGHSQGGWIVLEAAAIDQHAAFVISSSGPGVTVGDQDRFAVATAVASSSPSVTEFDAALELYDECMDILRSGRPWEDLIRRLEDSRIAPQVRLLERAGFSRPTADEWRHLGMIVDHDPVAAMRRIDRPVLALFGDDDALIPVERSVEIFERELGDRGPLTTNVFSGADHRMQIGDPPVLAPRYLETLSEWILEVTAGDSGRP
jgi:pimeloyl-ACP methyl ester carboxylesterase